MQTDAQPKKTSAQAWSNLTAFKQDMIVATMRRGGTPDAAESTLPHGLAIKSELEVMRGTEISHARLYPNLDDLADAGMVEKGTRDKRTNTYSVTTVAVDVFHAWLSDYAGIEVNVGSIPASARDAYERQSSTTEPGDPVPDGGTVDAATVFGETHQAVCQDCDRSWDGSGVDEVGEAHATGYDHEVVVRHVTVYNGGDK